VTDRPLRVEFTDLDGARRFGEVTHVHQTEDGPLYDVRLADGRCYEVSDHQIIDASKEASMPDEQYVPIPDGATLYRATFNPGLPATGSRPAIPAELTVEECEVVKVSAKQVQVRLPGRQSRDGVVRFNRTDPRDPHYAAGMAARVSWEGPLFLSDEAAIDYLLRREIDNERALHAKAKKATENVYTLQSFIAARADG